MYTLPKNELSQVELDNFFKKFDSLSLEELRMEFNNLVLKFSINEFSIKAIRFFKDLSNETLIKVASLLHDELVNNYEEDQHKDSILLKLIIHTCEISPEILSQTTILKGDSSLIILLKIREHLEKILIDKSISDELILPIKKKYKELGDGNFYQMYNKSDFNYLLKNWNKFENKDCIRKTLGRRMRNLNDLGVFLNYAFEYNYMEDRDILLAYAILIEYIPKRIMAKVNSYYIVVDERTLKNLVSNDPTNRKLYDFIYAHRRAYELITISNLQHSINTKYENWFHLFLGLMKDSYLKNGKSKIMSLVSKINNNAIIVYSRTN